MKKLFLLLFPVVMFCACNSDSGGWSYTSTTFDQSKVLGQTYKNYYMDFTLDGADSVTFRLYKDNYQVAVDSGRAPYKFHGDTLLISDIYPDSVITDTTKTKAHINHFVGIYSSNECVWCSFYAVGRKAKIIVNSGTGLMAFYRKDIWYDALKNGGLTEK